LDRLESDGEVYFMEPDDDPLLLHVEVLDGNVDADGDGVRDIISQDEFQFNARLLINKIYYRQNTYIESSQHCDAEDFKIFLPITVCTVMSTVICFLASSPILENHPRKICFFGGILGIAAVVLGTIQNELKMGARAEQYRVAALQYRLLATALEEKLLKYLKYPEASEEREKAAIAWKEYFEEVSNKIRVIQSETNLPPLHRKVSEWILKSLVNPNKIDQPCRPPRHLSLDEKLESACIITLDRAAAKNEKLDEELEHMGISKEQSKTLRRRKFRKNK